MARAKHQEPEHEAGMERWLLTYADLITLLMAFFVIMYAMSNVDSTKYAMMAKSLKVALGLERAGKGLIPTMSGDHAGNDREVALNDKGMTPSTAKVQLANLRNAKEEREFAIMIDKIKQYTKKEGIMSGVTAKMDSRGIVINLSDKVLFESGKADLSLPAQQILDSISEVLVASGKHIKVEGHTDNIPISNERYPSNWHLSTDRATSVIMYLLAKYPKASHRLSASGYGEHRPIASNTTVAGRAKNRRVDIILLRDIIAKGEPTTGPEDHSEKIPTKREGR